MRHNPADASGALSEWQEGLETTLCSMSAAIYDLSVHHAPARAPGALNPGAGMCRTSVGDTSSDLILHPVGGHIKSCCQNGGFR